MGEGARPRSVDLFGWSYAAWILLWIADSVLRWPITRAMVLRRFPEAGDLGVTVLLAESAAAIMIAVLVGWLAWRSPNGIARWLAVVVLALAGLLRVLGLLSLRIDLLGILWVLGLAAIAASLWFVFQPDARTWYDGPATAVDDDDEERVA